MAFRLMFKLRVDAKKLFEHPAVPIIVGFILTASGSGDIVRRSYVLLAVYLWFVVAVWHKAAVLKKMASCGIRFMRRDSRSCANGDHVLVTEARG